jgi:hypothetical protein
MGGEMAEMLLKKAVKMPEVMIAAEVLEISTDPVELRERILDLRTKIETSFVELAQCLFDVHENCDFASWGFATFKEYCEEELQIKYRRCAYMVQIASKVKELGFSWDVLKELGWTKARVLIPVLGREETGRTSEAWIEYAKGKTVKALEVEVAEVKKSESAIAGIKTRDTEIRYSVVFDETQLQLVSDTIDSAKDLYDVKKPADALAAICYEWSVSQAEELPDFEITKKHIEKMYGVKLEVAEQQSITDMLKK